VSTLGWILLSLFALLLMIMLSPVCASVSYNENGFSVTLKFLFLHMTFPRTKKNKHKEKASFEKKPQPKQKGKLKDLIALIKLAIQMLGKLLKSIRIRDLKIDALIASENPFKTAMLFGTSGATVGILLPLIERHFRVDRRTVNVNADFERTESSVDLFAKCSIRVIQVLAIALVFAYNFQKDRKKRKDVANVRTKSE